MTVILRGRREVLDLANNLHRYPTLGFDTESSGPILPARRKTDEFINVYRSSLTGCSISVADLDAYIPIGHRKGNCDLASLTAFFSALRDYPGVLSAHNLKHERKTERWSNPLKCSYLPERSACTQVLTWITQRPSSDENRPYNLKKLSKTHLGMEQATFEEATKGYDFSQLDPSSPSVLKYAGDDAIAARLLWEKFSPELAEHGLEEWFWGTEMPFLDVLARMEDTGVEIDSERLLEAIRAFQAEVDDLECEWLWLLPKKLKITSSKDLQWFFTEGHWSTEGVPRGKSGALCTKKDYVAEQLTACSPGSLGHEAARIKLRHSALTKLCSTYGQALLDRAWSYPDLRAHGSVNPTGTATGRVSMSDPNFQNIPARSKEGKRIREAIVAGPGKLLLSADFSQIELRVLAHLLGKGDLFNGYALGEDVHENTAKAVGVERSVAKNLNFLVVYGGGAKKLAATGGGLSLPAAKAALLRFKQKYPEIFELKDRMIAVAEKRGYIKTISGRFRRLDIAKYRAALRKVEHLGRNSPERNKAWGRLGKEERRAPNTAVQGSAGDIMKLAMLRVDLAIDHRRARFSNQVHDDLILEVDEDYVDEAQEIMQVEMESAYKLKVPLVVGPARGRRWSEHK